MQKLIIYIFSFIFVSETIAQQLVNGNFDVWSSIINNGNRIDYPNNWTLYSLSSQTINYNGDRVRRPNRESSICIRAYGEPGSIFQYDNTSYLSYGIIVGKKNEINFQKWGVPNSNRPTKVTGEYKFYNSEHPEDAGYAYIFFSKYNPTSKQRDTVGFGNRIFPINANDNDPWISGGYEVFEIDIDYRNMLTQPDTMTLVFVNSKYQELVSFNKYAGGLFFIDNVSLVEAPASISDGREVEITLTLYPNPTNTILQVSTSLQIAKLVVYQSNGTRVLENKSTETLDVSTLPEGLYLLEVWDINGKRIVKKFEKR